jgi:hypothetical protein
MVSRAMTDEDAAYAAAAWASGTSQTELARQFGYRQAALVSAAIRDFIDAYYPDPGARRRRGSVTAGVYNEERKLMVFDALAAYCATRSDAVVIV